MEFGEYNDPLQSTELGSALEQRINGRTEDQKKQAVEISLRNGTKDTVIINGLIDIAGDKAVSITKHNKEWTIRLEDLVDFK